MWHANVCWSPPSVQVSLTTLAPRRSARRLCVPDCNCCNSNKLQRLGSEVGALGDGALRYLALEKNLHCLIWQSQVGRRLERLSKCKLKLNCKRKQQPAERVARLISGDSTPICVWAVWAACQVLLALWNLEDVAAKPGCWHNPDPTSQSASSPIPYPASWLVI